MTASELRRNIYQLLDQVLKTGVPLEINKLASLKRRDCIVGDPEDIVHMDWSKEWRPFDSRLKVYAEEL